MKDFITALLNLDKEFNNLTEQKKLDIPNILNTNDEDIQNAVATCKTIASLKLKSDKDNLMKAMETFSKIMQTHLFKLEEDPTNEDLRQTARDLITILNVLQSTILGD